MASDDNLTNVYVNIKVHITSELKCHHLNMIVKFSHLSCLLQQFVVLLPSASFQRKICEKQPLTNNQRCVTLYTFSVCVCVGNITTHNQRVCV